MSRGIKFAVLLMAMVFLLGWLLGCAGVRTILSYGTKVVLTWAREPDPGIAYWYIEGFEPPRMRVCHYQVAQPDSGERVFFQRSFPIDFVGKKVYYQVCAFDSAGNQSPWSEIVSTELPYSGITPDTLFVRWTKFEWDR